MTFEEIVINELKRYSNDEKAASAYKFFQTHKGGYGEGDRFLGVSVPDQRKAAAKVLKYATTDGLTKLIRNPIHEARLTCLFIMVKLFEKNKNEEFRAEIVDIYLKNTRYVNNWDLVDSSAHLLVGAYFENKDKELIYALAISESLWERRIAMISTYYYIRKGSFDDALKIAEILLPDKQDLIQKAVGWMLREIGNRDISVEIDFLDKHYKRMGRTALRYSIEKFPEEVRKFYMS